MQFFSAKPLIEKFRTGAFSEEEVGPYFVTGLLLEAFLRTLPLTVSHPTKWDTMEYVGRFLVMAWGIFYLKQCNGGSFGRGFFNRYFALGWVMSIRMLCLFFPLCLGCVLIGKLLGGNEGIDFMGAVAMVVSSLIYYRWLGSLFVESRTLPQEIPVGA